MDFVTGLPHTSHGSDSVWVIVDQLTKSTHFILVHVSFNVERLTHIYIHEIICHHGVSVSIIFYRGFVFTSHF